MYGSDEVTIISNRSGRMLRDRVVEEYKSKLGEEERDRFERVNSFEKNFRSGEVYAQLQENVRRGKVHIIAGAFRPKLYYLRRKIVECLNNDKDLAKLLMEDYMHSIEGDFSELLKLLDATRRSGAQEVSVYLGYFPDSRQDKKDEPRVPISAKLRFDQIGDAGSPKLSRIGVIDLHAQQEQGFTNYPVDQITLKSLFMLYVKSLGVNWKDVVLVCPDPNDYQNKRKFADELELPTAIIEKRRSANKLAKADHILGADVKDKVCVTLDDMIDTGGTNLSAGNALIDAGAREVIACAAHGIFSPVVSKDGEVRFAEDAFKESKIKVVTTDTVARNEEYLREHGDWLTVLTTAPLIADLIYCNETGTSHGKKLEKYKKWAISGELEHLEKFLLRQI